MRTSDFYLGYPVGSLVRPQILAFTLFYIFGEHIVLGKYKKTAFFCQIQGMGKKYGTKEHIFQVVTFLLEKAILTNPPVEHNLPLFYRPDLAEFEQSICQRKP